MLCNDAQLEEKPLKTVRSMVQRFMERYRLTLRVPKVLAFSREDLADKISTFKIELLDLIQQKGIKHGEVWNMD